MDDKKFYGYSSFAGNLKYTDVRTKEINRKLQAMVDEGAGPLSLAEIAERCGMSKQAVHQIEQSALRKIRNKHPKLIKEILSTRYELPYLSC